MDKTNVMRILDSAKVSYNHYSYTKDLTDGVSVARALGKDEKTVFKTLVTTFSNQCYVFVIPVCDTLDLKKAARAVEVKNLEMLHQKDLLPKTGYIHGGCSPIGMKKLYKTVIDISCLKYDTIVFSAGKIGYQVELNPRFLQSLIKAMYCDVVVKK